MPVSERPKNVSETLRPGARVGRFLLKRKLGEGSFGVAYEAADEVLETSVALKIVHSRYAQDATLRERCRREIVLARRIAHPGVCRVYDLHTDDGLLAISMDLVDGQSIAEMLAAYDRLGKRPELFDAVMLLAELCSAVQAAHDVGVIHRDLKPANVIVRNDGYPVVLDFGIATANDLERLTRPGVTMGSLRYIAPELFLRGVATSVSDVYSLGVMGYSLLSLRPPFDASDRASLLRQVETPAPRLAVATPVADAIARALSLEPEHRFQTPRAFGEALRKAMQSQRAASPIPSERNASALGDAHETTVLLNALSQASSIDEHDTAEAQNPLGKSSLESRANAFNENSGSTTILSTKALPKTAPHAVASPAPRPLVAQHVVAEVTARQPVQRRAGQLVAAALVAAVALAAGCWWAMGAPRWR